MTSPPSGSEPGDRFDSKQSTSLTLLGKLRNKLPEAWDRVDRLYGPLIGFWCARAGVRPADIDDVRQVVLIKVDKKLDDFRRDRPGDSFQNWLYGITHNSILEHFREVKDQPRGIGGTDANLMLQALPGRLPLEAEVSKAETAALYHRALALIRSDFPESYLQAFVLHVVNGRTAKETAAELGMKPAAVRQAKSRILKRVKEELGDA